MCHAEPCLSPPPPHPPPIPPGRTTPRPTLAAATMTRSCCLWTTTSACWACRWPSSAPTSATSLPRCPSTSGQPRPPLPVRPLQQAWACGIESGVSCACCACADRSCWHMQAAASGLLLCTHCVADLGGRRPLSLPPVTGAGDQCCWGRCARAERVVASVPVPALLLRSPAGGSTSWRRSSSGRVTWSVPRA